MMEAKNSKESPLQVFTRSTIITNGVLCTVGAYWFYQVAKHVPEPYLDEVFHIRQALAYCNNQWNVWDPKITTPPGLYVFSYAWFWVLQSFGSLGNLTVQLRSLNLLAGVVPLYFTSRRLLYITSKRENDSYSTLPSSDSQWEDSLPPVDHVALNICLFPPLFFFYALFYTDVLSTELVLLALSSFHSRKTKTMLVQSLLALTLRQTNIFWVAIYLGGLEVLGTLEKRRSGRNFPDRPAVVDVIVLSWRHGYLYDPPMSTAYFEDYLKCGISLLVASLANPFSVLKSLTPYISLLLTFGAFVFWNGDVVLGDKSNHTASLHLSQMLYIWPYITFFSLPVLVPHFLALLPQRFVPLPLRTAIPCHPLPRLIVSLPILVLMTTVVHYNTLVHPFTLADNRHYTFYVFRLLLRHPAIKYLVVPVYFACAWGAIAVLGSAPLLLATTSKQTVSELGESYTSGSKIHQANSAPQTGGTRPKSASNKSSGNKASFLLVYLLTTALSLITAPLVEPRYFILPWLMWRMNITPPVSSRPSARTSTSSISFSRPSLAPSNQTSILPLETLYFLIINAATGYIFLHRTFTWPQEEGKLQRFMW